jgi:hypothetical protein
MLKPVPLFTRSCQALRFHLVCYGKSDVVKQFRSGYCDFSVPFSNPRSEVVWTQRSLSRL